RQPFLKVLEMATQKQSESQKEPVLCPPRLPLKLQFQSPGIQLAVTKLKLPLCSLQFVSA
ncbi:hypothetical protein A2U01_0014623, partial [Trifolium medium]|nr:hypothetical protein [Trifolium medium]